MISFAQGLGPLSIAPIFPQLIEKYNTDLAGAVQFTGVAILVLGFSNFIWHVPLFTQLHQRLAKTHSNLSPGFHSVPPLGGGRFYLLRVWCAWEV